MELSALVRRLDGKVVSEGKLSRYFGTKSLDELLLTLRRLARDDYFKFEVMLSAEYFAWADARRTVVLRTDVLVNAPDPFGALQQDPHGLSVKSGRPLSEIEIIEVVRGLPNDLAKRYVQFKLVGIDQERLQGFVEEQLKLRGGDEDEFYDRVEYNGLAIDGVKVTYNGETIDGLGFQHRQALRLLIKKKGKLCYKDEFTHAEAGIYNTQPTDHALRNLVHEVRKALKPVTGLDCIKNTPGEGWSLRIEI